MTQSEDQLLKQILDRLVPAFQPSKDWFYFARTDLLVVNVLFEQDEILYVTVGFHLQQCMEKAIKGYLKIQKIRFSKTHDMNYLLTLLEKANQGLANSLEWAGELTDYAVHSMRAWRLI